jgi:ribosomal protein L11 methyltransferase
MQWLQLLIDVGRERSTIVEDAIFECGAVSFTLEDAADQPIYAPGIGEQPLWDNCAAKALFPASIDVDAINQQLSDLLQPAPAIRWELLEDKDWSEEWKKYFQPLKCGTRLWICPSWIDPPEPDAINLSLDPGIAFGTGSHPTTHLCLRWLEQQDLAGKIVIDYGCGSGILGIAALLLGAEKVYAVDNDPQALLASRDNAQRNQIADDRLMTFLPEEVPSDLYAEVMLANILAAPLMQLAPVISDLTAADGLLCLSGLLESQTDDVSEPYLAHFDFSTAAVESDWSQLSAVKVR